MYVFNLFLRRTQEYFTYLTAASSWIAGGNREPGHTTADGLLTNVPAYNRREI